MSKVPHHTRRTFVIILSALTAGTTATLALFQRNLGQGLSVLLGYAILLMSSVLMNICIAGSTDNTKRTALLVFSLGVLVFFLGGIAFILSSNKDEHPMPPVTEAHITEHTATAAGGLDAGTGIQVADDPTEATITPNNTVPTASDSSDTTGEPFSIYSEYHTTTEPLQSGDHVPDAESNGKNPPSAPNATNTVNVETPEATVINITPEAPELSNAVSASSEPVIIELGETAEEQKITELEEAQTKPQTDDEPVSIPVAESNEEYIVPAEPVVPSTEDISSAEEVGVPRDMTAQEHFDDFWSSFYIAGEDELQLEDGIYYMTLIINDNEAGSIGTLFMDGVVSLNSKELRQIVSGAITDEAENRIFFEDSEYISVDSLRNSGVGVEVLTGDFLIEMTFSSADMPIQILSVRSGGVRRGSLNRLPLTDASVLDPAVFTWAARYSLSSNFNILPGDSFADSVRMTFRMDNRIRLYDLYLNFDFSVRYNNYGTTFDFGSYRFYYDFEDEMTRLQWGNISTDLLSPVGTPVGIRFDKAIEYGGPDATRKSHVEQILTLDKESEVIILNAGNEIFRRTLQPGNYRLQDFVLYTGVNEIQIIVNPLDGSQSSETDIDLIYSSSLLAPGEVYYGGSLSTGRRVVSSSSPKLSGSLRIPYMNGTSLEYDIRNIALGGYIRAGITESFTLNTSLAISNRVSEASVFLPRARAAFEATHANILGTTRYNLNLTENSDSRGNFTLPSIYARVGHQVSFDFRPFSSMSLGLSYSVDLANRPDRHSFMLSSSFSGSLGMLGWGLSLTGTMYSDDIMSSMYSGSLTLSLSASRNVYFSAGLSMNGSFTEAPSVFGRASATIRFNPARATISISENDLSAEVSVSNNRHSFSAESSVLPRNIAVFDDYSFHADYSYSGDFINFGAGFNANNSFDRLSGNLSISTSSVFADGLMAFGSTIPSNYILISQSKALKGNEISVGSVGSSMSTPIDTIFGVGLYTGLSLNRTTSLSVYSINSESFGSAAAFDVTIPATGRGGYVLRLAAENKYSLSGIVELPDGSVWANGSSPVYMVEETDSGIMLLPSEYYVFADNSGRFIVTDFEEGRYAFDVSYGDEWLLYEFYVFENEEHHTDIQMLENPHVDKTEVLSDVYSGHYVFDNGEYLTGNEFWAMLYPELEEAV